MDGEEAAAVFAEFKAKPKRRHHDFSPSQLSSLRACPSYEGAQSETPHFRTAIGTLIHDVVESGNDNAKLSDEDAGYAAYFMNFCAEQKAKMGPGAVELQEVYGAVDDYDTTAGYLDDAIINAAEDEAVLMDLKTGVWPVPPAKENLQTNAYALGLFRNYPKLQSIKVFIVQPALDYVSDHVIKREDIPTLYSEIWAVVARAKAARLSGNFATARAFYPMCSFCRHVGNCPVVAKLAGEVGAKFAPLMVPADVSPSAIHDPANVKLGWQLAQVVEAWATSWRQVITNRVLCGGKPPEGYKLVTRSKREIVDAKKYREIAITRLTPEEYDGTLKPSLTAVEDLISEKAPRGGKTAAVKQFSEELQSAGAVVEGESSAFLKAVPTKPVNE